MSACSRTERLEHRCRQTRRRDGRKTLESLQSVLLLRERDLGHADATCGEESGVSPQVPELIFFKGPDRFDMGDQEMVDVVLVGDRFGFDHPIGDLDLLLGDL